MAALWDGLLALRDNWEEEDYPKAEDFKYMLVFALFFVTLRYILDQLVFEVLEAVLVAIDRRGDTR